MHGADAWRSDGAIKHTLNGTSYNDFARDELSQLVVDLTATPVEMIEETLRLCAPRLHEMIELNLLDHGQVVDELWGACAATGYVSERGPDALQSLLAAHLPAIQASVIASSALENEQEDANAAIKAWPLMESKAMHGLAGAIAKLATATSEADPVAVLVSALTYAAAEFGRSQYIRIGDDAHHSRHFSSVVGNSSRARKGTSFGPVGRIFGEADKIRRAASTLPFPSGHPLKVSRGPLSSGEGLIYAIRDKSQDDEEDVGVVDKRLLVIEAELGSAFRAFQRNGNNLSMIIRTVFDGDTVEPLTKNNRIRATDPHINIIGHITRQELKQLLSANEVWNGLGNRFLWFCARRPRTVPFPRPMPQDEVNQIAKEVARVTMLAHSRPGYEMTMSNSAMDHWANVYPELTADHPGVLGAITSRTEVHARRLALTYAQLDGAERIEIVHLEAALAVCRYAFDSALYLFGGSELSPIAQTILKALPPGHSMTQTEISALFSRHLKKQQLESALRDLQDGGRITLSKQKTRGAPRMVWSRA